MLSNNFSIIQNVLDNYDYVENQNLEIEARFGTFVDNGVGNRYFDSTVPFSHFSRVLDTLLKHKQEYKYENNTSKVEISGNIRKIVHDDYIQWQTKTGLIRNINLDQYDVRISVKIETDIEQPKNFMSSLTRIRNRHSFWINDGNSRIDLTEVTKYNLDSKNVAYEVEVEHIGGDLSLFNSAIESIFKLLKGTNIIYTNDVKNKLNREIGQILSGNPREIFIRKNVLVNARNIKRVDLGNGGIIGSKFGSYNVTYKADGLRKMLIIHTTGIWLVYPSNEYNLVVSPSQWNHNIFNILSGTVFDGELVQLYKNQDSLYYFFVFDCLSYKSTAGNVALGAKIQNEKYKIRKKFIDNTVKYFRNPYIYTDVKETIEFDTSDGFFDAVGRLLKNKNSLNYKDDGLIFTPVDQPYNPHSDKFPLSSRTLSNHPDVCKWKPPSEMTIDFYTERLSNGKINLSVFSVKKGVNVSFKGDQINKLTKDMIDYNNTLLKYIEPGTIVEFGWNGSLLVPRKIRFFKGSANTEEVALDNWSNIFHPITEEILLDKSFKAVFKHHNFIKRSLFKEIHKSESLLDIGSGRGGDVISWVNINSNIRVVAVEPNDQNRKELKSRIGNSIIKGNVNILDVKGEDSKSIRKAVLESIPGGKVDSISIMLSLSFFWKSDSHLDSLVRTIINNIKPGGVILFLTIDGDTEEELLEPALHPNLWRKSIDINGVKITLYPKTEKSLGRPSDFIIPGENIVGNQREYIVKLKDLELRLEKYGFKLENMKRASSNSFMVPENNILSSLYSYGNFRHNGKTKLVEPEFVEPEFEIIINPEGLLHWLPVQHIDNNGNYVTGDADGDDEVERLKCSWCNDIELVRIATIGDGSCFFHTILKAMYPKYQENSNAIYRLGLVSKLRRDLASYLSHKNPKYPEFSYYETSGEGSIPVIALQEFINNDIINDIFKGIDFSPLGLKSLLNSFNTIGDELYSYVADVLDIDIYILRATSDDLYPHLFSINHGNYRNSVIISANESHYELIGVVTPNGIQTLFKPKSDVINIIRSIFNIEESLNNSSQQFDTTLNFKKEVEVIISQPDSNLTIEILENKLREVLPHDDPLLHLYLKSIQ
jgi:precorrin-6B methylase 2